MPPIIDDSDRGQVVPLGALKVVGVVRGRNFDGARAKGLLFNYLIFFPSNFRGQG